MNTIEAITPDVKSTILVEVFKTNVLEQAIAEEIVMALQQQQPEASINFDLEDCDKILRIAHDTIDPLKIIECVEAHGFYCAVLED